MSFTEDRYIQEGTSDSVDWGFLPGESQKLLLIKTGLGGSIYGYNGKYIHIARHFHSEGYSVLCCASPQNVDDRTSFEVAIDTDSRLMGTRFADVNIDYMGISRGAYQGILYGNTVEQIESMLLINPPLTVNFSKQITALRNVDKPSVLVIGTRDASFRFWQWICEIKNANLQLLEAEGADHHFKGMDQEFFDLPVRAFLAE